MNHNNNSQSLRTTDSALNPNETKSNFACASGFNCRPFCKSLLEQRNFKTGTAGYCSCQ